MGDGYIDYLIDRDGDNCNITIINFDGDGQELGRASLMCSFNVLPKVLIDIGISVDDIEKVMQSYCH